MTRDEAYTRLYSLIFRGFLTGGLEMGEALFMFKTTTEKEFEQVKMCAGNPDNPRYLGRFNMYFLAYSLFSIDGENILVDRSKIPVLASFFSNISGYLFKYLMSELDKMRNECYDVLKYLEGFCYTSDSRRRWKIFKGLPLNSDTVTGVPGTSFMGLNVFQENWVYLNRVMDEEEEYNKDFSFALYIASATNPKGVRQSRNHHESHVKNMEDHRKKLAEVGYIDTKNWGSSEWAAPVDTAEELVAELDRQMKGMKDRHDRFIEDHLKKIREKADRKTKEAEERIRAYQNMHSDMPLLTVEQRPLTPEETVRLVHRRIPTTKTVRSDNVSGEDSSRVLKKIGSKVLTSRR